MRSHRFYTDIALNKNTSVELPPEAAHHCAQVLRYKVTDQLTVFNGDGYDYSATVSAIEKKRCQIRIDSKSFSNNESPLKIHLIQGIARGDKMDLIIQKAVELGVIEITPLFTERCNVKLDKKRLDKKIIHWQKTIISACEQSGRSIIPQLNQPVSIEQLKLSKNTNTVLLEPTANDTFSSITINDSVNLLIGPEGGFSDKDLAQARDLNIRGIKLGPRILRTETAGLSVIAILQNRYGDL